MTDNANRKARAKKYEKIKLITDVTQSLLTFLLVLALLITGFTKELQQFTLRYSSNPYIQLLIFGAVLGAIAMAVSFPFDYVFGFRMERKYDLSNLTFAGWIKEKAKTLAVGLILGLPIVLLFYWLVSNYYYWWIIFGFIVTFYSILLAKIAPIFIFPIFYKFKPLEDDELKNRIVALCERIGFRISGVFAFDMSKTTKKANAAFTGIGKTRRIIIGDTLLSGFSHDEIETVFAHELGHYKKGHIRNQIIISFFSTFFMLFLASEIFDSLLPVFGFTLRSEIAALPLLMLITGALAFILGPFGAFVSRKYEFEADRFAVEITGKLDVFRTTMEKLAFQNLSDEDPPKLVEFWFHSHPSIKRRIASAESYFKSLEAANA